MPNTESQIRIPAIDIAIGINTDYWEMDLKTLSVKKQYIGNQSQEDDTVPIWLHLVKYTLKILRLGFQIGNSATELIEQRYEFKITNSVR